MKLTSSHRQTRQKTTATTNESLRKTLTAAGYRFRYLFEMDTERPPKNVPELSCEYITQSASSPIRRNRLRTVYVSVLAIALDRR
ncbi:hypothetical protein GWI33_006483 [Rhynchophorus ferrugineus]|uniref:Uncharacterized protein n=1 Tax=Rhynchophorus ferrugineus TaxID=354439 RepID=A0A834IFS2_RHYFE|nr:hypothetical protein GWI33_006483 [Rhynchophorus ferrugineus]